MKKLSSPQRIALSLLSTRDRNTAAHQRDGYVSAIVAMALVKRGLAEYASVGTLVIITQAGRTALAAGGKV